MKSLQIARWSLYSLAVITPFIVSQNLLFSYVNGKMFFVRLVAFIVALCFSIIFLGNKSDTEYVYAKFSLFIKSRIAQIITLGIVSLGISTLFAFNKMVAFFGEPQRTEGFLTLFSCYILFVALWVFFDKKEWKNFFALTSTVSIIIFLISFGQLIGGDSRPQALQGNPTFLGGYFIFPLFTSLYLWMKKEKYVLLGAIGSIAAILGIIISGTRAAVFGLAFALIVSAILGIIYGRKEYAYRGFKKASMWVLGALIAFSVLLIVTPKASLWQSIPGINRVLETNVENVRNSSRALFYEQALTKAWGEGSTRVAVGWGWDNYTFFWQKNYNPEIFYYDEAVADRSHNKFIDMLIMTGLLGLGLYLALWVVYLVRIFKRLQSEGLKVLPYIFFTVVYFTFLFFTFDIIFTLLGFYALLAFMEYEKNA